MIFAIYRKPGVSEMWHEVGVVRARTLNDAFKKLDLKISDEIECGLAATSKPHNGYTYWLTWQRIINSAKRLKEMTPIVPLDMPVHAPQTDILHHHA